MLKLPTGTNLLKQAYSKLQTSSETETNRQNAASEMFEKYFTNSKVVEVQSSSSGAFSIFSVSDPTIGTYISSNTNN
jgi:hypothetical protein